MSSRKTLRFSDKCDREPLPIVSLCNEHIVAEGLISWCANTTQHAGKAQYRELEIRYFRIRQEWEILKKGLPALALSIVAHQSQLYE
jgi:hypothetical protein